MYPSWPAVSKAVVTFTQASLGLNPNLYPSRYPNLSPNGHRQICCHKRAGRPCDRSYRDRQVRACSPPLLPYYTTPHPHTGGDVIQLIDGGRPKGGSERAVGRFEVTLSLTLTRTLTLTLT